MCEDSCAVYVHVNLINGKKYFGITIQEPEKRWKNGYGYSNNAHFKNAILKYGWDNFGHYILYHDISIKIAENIEKLLINEHMSYDPRFGYNKTMGGELEVPTKETRQKISESMKGHEVAEETKKKISESMKGIMRSEEVKKKMSEATPKKAVEAIDPITWLRVYYFESTKSVGRAGFHQGHVCDCCNGKQKTHKGYYWRYVEGGDNDDSDNRRFT